MTLLTPHFVRALLVLSLTVASLFGCANHDGAGRQIVTDSDETEASRRARIRLELAGAYFQEDKIKVALDEVKQALLAEPNNHDAYNMRGMIYMRLNEPELAEESFKKALSLRPQDPSVMHNYGWFLCAQSRTVEAIRWFEQALTVRNYTGAAKTHMALGMCHQKNAQSNAALTSYLRAYELEPGNPIVGYNLGLLAYQRADFSKAQFYVRRINNSELANAQSLWLGLKIERKLGNNLAVRQLSDQLRKRFASSEEAQRDEKGYFDD